MNVTRRDIEYVLKHLRKLKTELQVAIEGYANARIKSEQKDNEYYYKKSLGVLTRTDQYTQGYLLALVHTGVYEHKEVAELDRYFSTLKPFELADQRYNELKQEQTKNQIELELVQN